MFRKDYLFIFLFITFVTIGSSEVFAQTITGSSTTDKPKTIGGIIEKKSSDGKKAPAEGVKIDCYRMDVKESCGSTVTDAKGEFSLSVPEKSDVVLATSGTGLAASVVTSIRMDTTNAIDVSEGDGAVPSEENVRYVALVAYKEGGKLSAEQKKELADLEERTAKAQANNEKIKEKNEARTRLVKEGSDAFNQGNFDLAIAKFEEGYQLDPEFIGSAPSFLNNKAQALKQRAVNKYNEAAKSKDAGRIRQEKESLVKDFTEALDSVTKAYSLVKNSEKSGGGNATTNKEVLKFSESIVRDALKVLSQLNLNLASNTEEETTKGVKISKDLLVMLPKDPDVLAILGLSLFASGEMQESLNYFAYYMEVAPKEHNRREAVGELVTYLTTDEKLKPQKIN